MNREHNETGAREEQLPVMGADVAEVIHRMSALELMRLVNVAMGKLASPNDWEVIVKAHVELHRAFERGRQHGRTEGMREALADTERPMQEFIDKLQAGSRSA